MFGRKKSPSDAGASAAPTDFGVTQSAEDLVVQASDIGEFATPGQRKMALGITWQFAAGKKQAATKLAALRKARLRCVSVAVQGDAAGAALVGALPGEYAKHWIGSLLMAQVIGAGVYMQRLSDGRYWVFAAADNLPLARHDRIVEGEEQAHEVLMSFMTDLGQTAIYGDCGGSQRSAQSCWEDVDDLIDSKRLPKVVLNAASPKSSSSAALVVLAFALLVGGAAGFWFLLRPAAPVPATGDRDRLAALMRAAQSEQEIAARRAQLRAQFDAEVNAQRTLARMAPLSEQLREVQAILEKMPRPVQHVRFMRMQCSMEIAPREQRWSCAPVVGASTQMGRLALLSLAHNPSQVQQSIEQGFTVRDSTIEIDLAPYTGSALLLASDAHRPWPDVDALAWRAYVLDTLSAHNLGEGVVGPIEMLPDLVVRSGDFSHDGIALEGVRDELVARVLRFNVTLPFAPGSAHVLGHVFAHRSARMHAFEIDASGRMVFGITLKQAL